MKISRTLLVLVGFAGLFSAGCHTRVYGRGYVQYSQPTVYVEEPELVYVEPGVYVVRDYDEAVYYSDGYYWSYRGGAWYHTTSWGSPWVVVGVGYVPYTLASRDHRAYAHYHGAAGAHTYHPAHPNHTAASPVPAPPPHSPASGSVHAHGGGSVSVGGNGSAGAGFGQKGNQRDNAAAQRAAHVDRSQAKQPDSQPDARSQSKPSRADAPQATRADAPQATRPAPAAKPKKQRTTSKKQPQR